MASYLANVSKDIERWREAGLIDTPTAQALIKDVAAHSRRGFSFGNILSILAAILVGAAILLLIASNWEAIPRLVRVAMVFAVIIGGYGGGALLAKRRQVAFAEGLWLIAAIAFGGGIALVGQMYHLTGDEADAFLLWGAGTALAAAALRSSPLTIAAALLAAWWMGYMGIEGGPGRGVPYAYPLYAAAIWAISIWTGSIIARHIILLSMILFAGIIYVDDADALVPVALAAISAAVFAFSVLRPELAARLTGLGGGLAIQGLLGFMAGMSVVQAEHHEGQGFLLAAIIVFAGIVAALLTAGRENRPLRWLAYAAFVFELCFVYVTLLGSMLGTSGFFLAAGLILGLLAWLIGRIEKRMSAEPVQTTGAGA